MIQWTKFYFLIISTILLFVPNMTYAQENPDPENILENDIVTFSELGINDVTAVNDNHTTTFYFAFPADWDLQEGVKFQLDTSSLLYGPEYSGEYISNATGMLNIEFNDHILESIFFDWGIDQTIDFFVPAEMLVSQRLDQRHDLYLEVRSGLQCGKLLASGIFIKPSSIVTVEHSYQPPLLDLRILPYPIYQQSFLEDSAVIVIPNNPSASALEAVMNVAAGFGYATSEGLNLLLVPERLLTDDLRQNNHLIFVGELELFDNLDQFDIPIDLEPALNKDSEGHGILQLVISPYNNKKVILIVTGLDSSDVSTAGQAISSFNVRTSQPHNVAIVKNINTTSLKNIDANIVNATLAQVGIDNILIDRLGMNSEGLEFQINDLSTIGIGAYIDTVVSHSALIDFDSSGINILVNDIPVGSIKFNEDTINNYVKRTNIPTDVFVLGGNTLKFQTMLNVSDPCFFTDRGAVWVNITPDTKIFIPRTSSEPLIETTPNNLNIYPNPYVLPETLDNTTFIVPHDDPSAWNVAMKVATNLGRSTDGRTISLAVQYDDSIDDIAKSENLIVVGTATTLPILSEWTEYLPIQFEENSNFIIEDDLAIAYDISEGRDLGYMLQFQSPYTEDRVVLLVSGTTNLGVEWSGNALVDPTLRRNLFGDFAIIDEFQVTAQRLKPIPKRLATENSELSEEITEVDPSIQILLDESAEIEDRPNWIIPTMRLVLVLMAGVIVFVFLTTILRFLYSRFKRTRE